MLDDTPFSFISRLETANKIVPVFRILMAHALPHPFLSFLYSCPFFGFLPLDSLTNRNNNHRVVKQKQKETTTLYQYSATATKRTHIHKKESEHRPFETHSLHGLSFAKFRLYGRSQPDHCWRIGCPTHSGRMGVVVHGQVSRIGHSLSRRRQ